MGELSVFKRLTKGFFNFQLAWGGFKVAPGIEADE
jgi:hypothetical protein